MSVTKHTPGPWTHIPGGFTIKAPSDHHSFQLIASLSTGMKTRSEVEANARLIAAAPDLLEALQTIAGYLDDTAACNSDKAMASTARAAIAKATGGAPCQ